MRFGDVGMLLVPDEIKMRIGFSWDIGYNLTTLLFLLIHSSRLQFRKIIVFVCLFSLVGVRVGMVANRLSDCQKITKKLLQLTLSLLSCQKIREILKYNYLRKAIKASWLYLSVKY